MGLSPGLKVIPLKEGESSWQITAGEQPDHPQVGIAVDTGTHPDLPQLGRANIILDNQSKQIHHSESNYL